MEKLGGMWGEEEDDTKGRARLPSTHTDLYIILSTFLTKVLSLAQKKMAKS